MKKAKESSFYNAAQRQIVVFSLLWLGGCFMGTLLFYTCKFPQEELLLNHLNVLPRQLPPSIFQKDFWVLLISSSAQELLFLFSLAFLAFWGSGIHLTRWLFSLRGFLFGVGGSLIVTKAPFPLFCLVIFRQICLTAITCMFASSLFSAPFTEIKTTREGKAIWLLSLLCQNGLSLLVQFAYIFLLTKNQWI